MTCNEYAINSHITLLKKDQTAQISEAICMESYCDD